MATLSAGTLLGNGRYRVLKEVNRGGTAVVYECETIPTGEHVACKVMTVKDGRSTVPIKGVKREIEYTASVQHHNVVKLLDFFAESDHVVIVWELIRGPDLLDLLNECGGRLAEPDAAFYFGQLLQGVMFIHERGLCHRDLKPENVMIDRATARVKIIDFGLSKHQASAVTLGVGTPDYMAPELLGGGSVQTLYERRTGHYDARASDIWALGVLLYLLVTGLYPFEDPARPQNVVATLQNIMAGRMRPLPRRVSPACASLIHAMLTIAPERRISLQDIARHPWLANAEQALAARGHAQREAAAQVAVQAAAPSTPPPAPATPPPAATKQTDFNIKPAAESTTTDSNDSFRLTAGFDAQAVAAGCSHPAEPIAGSDAGAGWSLGPSPASSQQDEPATPPAPAPRRVSFAFAARTAPPLEQRHTPAMYASGRGAQECTSSGVPGAGTMQAPGLERARRPSQAEAVDAARQEAVSKAAERQAPRPKPSRGLGGFCRLWFGGRDDED